MSTMSRFRPAAMWILENWPAGTLLLAGILAAVATYVSSNRQAENETHVNKSLGSANELLTKATSAQEIADKKLTEANTKLDQAVTKQDDALGLHKQSLAMQQEAGEDQKKANEALAAANEMLQQTIEADRELIAKQQKVLDTFTGGDSIFYLSFTNYPGEAPHAQYEVLGEYPLRDVMISALNFSLDTSAAGQSLRERMQKAVHNAAADVAWPGCGLIMSGFPNPVTWEGNYQIVYSQSNGTALQLVRLMRIGNNTAVATRVFRKVRALPGGKSEYSEIKSLRVDDGFPKDASGRVEWLDYVDAWSSTIEIVEKSDYETK